MEPIAFVAASAEGGLAQIRARLGGAVVLNVRPLPLMLGPLCKNR